MWVEQNKQESLVKDEVCAILLMLDRAVADLAQAQNYTAEDDEAMSGPCRQALKPTFQQEEEMREIYRQVLKTAEEQVDAMAALHREALDVED
jgi:hypothetical protein